jgi:hypothetical protein
VTENDQHAGLGPSGVPYYAQWESPALVKEMVDGSLLGADDPLWAKSGARTPQEYEFWAGKTCGIACFKMVLARRARPVPPTMRLVERALEHGAYVPRGERVDGLIYAPFARMAAAEFGVCVDVARELTTGEIAAAATPDTPVIVSVHRWIRWPDRDPPERGGHLVLVTGALTTGAGGGALRLHNPSGFPGASQRDVMVRVADFAKFFAGRGMLIR